MIFKQGMRVFAPYGKATIGGLIHWYDIPNLYVVVFDDINIGWSWDYHKFEADNWEELDPFLKGKHVYNLYDYQLKLINTKTKLGNDVSDI